MEDVIGKVHKRGEGVFEWTVRDFFSLPEKQYYSPSFSFGGARWCFGMNPSGKKDLKPEGCITIELYRESPGPPIRLNYSFGLKTSKNEIVEETHDTCNFKKQCAYDGWVYILTRSELAQRRPELAPSDRLTWVWRLKRAPSTQLASLPSDSDSEDEVEFDENKTEDKRFKLSGAIPSAKCAHCKETLDAKRLPSHQRKCVNRPIKCPECSHVVALKHWYAHQCQPGKSRGRLFFTYPSYVVWGESRASGSGVKSKIKYFEKLATK